MDKTQKGEKRRSLKVVVFSDTHNLHEELKIPDGDILIHCGDFTHKCKITTFMIWY